MKPICLEACAQDAGARADVFVGEKMTLSRNAAQRLCVEGRVTCAGRPVRKSYRLAGDECLEVLTPEPVPSDALPQAIALDVVFEDDSVIVINKPRGMVVHPAAGHPDQTVVNALLWHCRGHLSGVGGRLRPGIVHRIDKDTSGLLIAAKTDAAHRSLAAQLQKRTLSRVYDAVVHGSPRADQGTVDAPIGRSTGDRKKMAVVRQGGRNAVTHYRVLARGTGFAHVRCALETGRTHQIRVHMAHIGHPIAGDTVYGPKRGVTALGGQCLHARELRFIHPVSGAPVELACPLPAYFVDFLSKIQPSG